MLALGLDISTSCTGYALIDVETAALMTLGWIDTSKDAGAYAKAEHVRTRLLELPRPSFIVVEEHVLGFRAGSSTAGTIVTLAKFNAVVSYVCARDLGIDPVSLQVMTARRLVGLKVPRGSNAKEHVIAWAQMKEPGEWWKTRTLKSGPRRGQVVLDGGCDDAADALLLVHAAHLNSMLIR